MQTRTYGDLFKLISALCGTGQELTVPEQDQLRHFINRRFEEAFNASPVWPRYFVPSEERKLSPFALAGTINSSYQVPYAKFGTLNDSDFFTPVDITGGNSGIFLYKTPAKKWKLESGVYTKSYSSGSAVAEDPVTVSAYNETQFLQSDSVDYASPLDVPRWIDNNGTIGGVLELDTLQLVPYSETLEFENSQAAPGRDQRQDIGEFSRIHRKEAFLNNSSLEYDFYVDFEGANVLNVPSGTEKVFVSYKKKFTPFTVTSGYYDSTVEVPGEFFNYIAHTAFADFIRMQGKTEQAAAEEGMGTMFLAQELEKIDLRSNNNTVNRRFSTYVSRQSR